jgi:multicomponent Na+:H+ antiporter subunit D
VGGAVAMAALGLFGPGVRATLARGPLAPLAAAVNAFRGLHSGHIGDYIAWWTVGAAVLGAASLLLLT